jgi:hypothetical protein
MSTAPITVKFGDHLVMERIAIGRQSDTATNSDAS